MWWGGGGTHAQVKQWCLGGACEVMSCSVYVGNRTHVNMHCSGGVVLTCPRDTAGVGH